MYVYKPKPGSLFITKKRLQTRDGFVLEPEIKFLIEDRYIMLEGYYVYCINVYGTRHRVVGSALNKNRVAPLDEE